MRTRVLPSQKKASSKRPKAAGNAIASTHLPVLSKSWFLHSEVAGCSASTLENRRLVVSKLEWFAEGRNLPQVDTNALLQFFLYLRNGHLEPGGRWGNPQNTKPASAGTIATYQRVLSAFFNFCIEQGDLETSPLDAVPQTINRPDQVQPLSEEQIRALIVAARTTPTPERDSLIIALLFDTGLRVSELCALAVGDVDMGRLMVTVKEGKGGKARYVPFAPEVRKAMFKYIATLDNAEEEDPLFPLVRGDCTQLSRRAIGRMLKRLAAKAGIPSNQICPHKMRHTYSIHYLRNGGNQFSLMSNLGHTSTTMTARYVAIAQADVEGQHKKSSPMTNLKKKRG